MGGLLATLFFAGLAVALAYAGDWLILLTPLLVLYVAVATWREFR